MKDKIVRHSAAFFCTWLSLCLAATSLTAQPATHTPRFSPFIDNNVNGFWEYLPRNYNTDVSQTYPLLVFIHGYGDSGSTPDSSTLRRVLNGGTPRIIGNGNFPDSFFVAGQWFKFIVISPQIKNGFLDLNSIVNPSTVDAVIEYAKSTYRVDTRRIYLGGLSMGGGAVWQYAGSSAAAAQKVAAITVAAGAADLSAGQAAIIGAAKLPVLATHNTVDDQILSVRTVNNILALTAANTVPAPKAFYWNTPDEGGGKHNVWSRTYEDLVPGSTPGGNLTDSIGTTVYHWMLQYERQENSLPVTWKSFSADPRNGGVVLTWQVSAEQNLRNYEAEKSRDGLNWSAFALLNPSSRQDSGQVYTVTDQAPYQGLSYYRLKQRDLDGKVTYSVVRTINLSAAGALKIYPSPFTGQLTLLFNDQIPAVADVLLVNAGGTVVAKKHVAQTGSGRQVILSGLEGLPRGLYYIKVTDQQGSVLAMQKVLK